jgi:hypothetical protein
VTAYQFSPWFKILISLFKKDLFLKESPVIKQLLGRFILSRNGVFPLKGGVIFLNKMKTYHFDSQNGGTITDETVKPESGL